MSYRWRRRRNLRRQVNKYNIENFANTVSTAVATTTDKNIPYNTIRSIIIPPNLSAGVRKITNLRGSLTTDLSKGSALIAIVYLPEGFDPGNQNLVAPAKYNDTSQTSPFSSLTVNTGNCYVPSQNVLWFGQIRSSLQSINWRVPLSKNLNGGDQILMLIKPLTMADPSTATYSFFISGQYAICYR